MENFDKEFQVLIDGFTCWGCNFIFKIMGCFGFFSMGFVHVVFFCGSPVEPTSFRKHHL